MERQLYLALSLSWLVAVALLPSSPKAYGQTPEASPSPTELEYEGEVVKVTRNFESASLRLDGALFILTIVSVFDSERHAKAAFETTTGIVDAFEAEGDFEIVDRNEISAPKVGEERHAETLEIEIDDLDGALTVIRAYEGKVLHFWMATGLANPTAELLTVVDEAMSFEDVDPDDDDEVSGLLPELGEMPAGFLLEDEEISRNEDDD